jgi:hypothetical protein
MATNKTKKEVKVRDLKPSKDAKGGVARAVNTGGGHRADGGKGHAADGKFGRNPNSKFVI